MEKTNYPKKKITIPKNLIKNQIIGLLKKADSIIKIDLELAQKYADQAKNIQKKTRVKFPSEWKKRFCGRCKKFLKPGINCTMRLSSQNKTVIVKCFHCKKYSRIPYYKTSRCKNE